MAVAPETVAGAIGAGAATGAVQTTGESMVAKGSPTQVTQSAVKGAVIGGATAGILSGAAKLVGAAGKGIVFQNVKPLAADFKDGLPSTAEGFSNLLDKYQIKGTMPQMLTQTQTQLTDLTSQLKTTLKDPSATPIDLVSVYDKTLKDMTTGTDKLKGFGSNTKIQGALDQLLSEVKEVNPSGTMSIPDAQIVKQAAGGKGAWEYGKTDPEAVASEKVYNKFYTHLKTAIEDASPAGVKDINSKISDLIPVQNALVRRIPIAQRNNALGIKDMIGLTASITHPGILPLEFANIASKSTWFGSMIKGASATAIAPAVGATAAAITGQPGSVSQETGTPPQQ